MKDPSTGGRAYGRTRWRRFGVLMAPALGVVTLLVYLVASGAIAVSFAVSGVPFTLSATQLAGTHFVQYATVDPTTNSAAGALLPAGSSQNLGGTQYDATTVTVLGSATITGLDQVVCGPLPGPLSALGNLKVELTSPGTVSASGLAVDAPLLTGSGTATFNNINIGEDLASSLSSQGLPSVTGAAGQFSQSADSVTINGVNQLAIGTSAGSFTLNGIHLAATFVSSC